MGKRVEGRGAVMQVKWVRVFFVALILLAVMTGCGDEELSTAPTASDFAAQHKALAARTNDARGTPAAKVADKVKPETENAGYAGAGRDYFYDSRNKRDPFRSFQLADEDRDRGREFGPLEDFELGQLELSAVIWDANNPRALILDPGGRAYIVRQGSLIGKNSGQVIHIGDSLVLVKETYENLAGERTTKDVELRIRLSQGG